MKMLNILLILRAVGRRIETILEVRLPVDIVAGLRTR
jgi:hypothetical protein